MPQPSASRSAGLAVEITRTRPPGTSAGGLTAVTERLRRFGVRGVGKRRVYTAARRGKGARQGECAVQVNGALPRHHLSYHPVSSRAKSGSPTCALHVGVDKRGICF